MSADSYSGKGTMKNGETFEWEVGRKNAGDYYEFSIKIEITDGTAVIFHEYTDHEFPYFELRNAIYDAGLEEMNEIYEVLDPMFFAVRY